MQDAARLQSQQQWATDPLFENTTLLLQADNAPNAAQNNTFLDSSANAFTITRNGNTTQGTFTPFSATGWSTFYTGTADNNATYLDANAAYSFGTGDFTIEAWVHIPPLSNTNGKIIMDSRPNATNGSFWLFGLSNTGQIQGTTMSTGGTTLTSPSSIPTNQWVHVAFTRASGALNLWVNGISVASASGNTNNISSDTIWIGRNAFSGVASDTWFAGYMSNVRIVKGVAVYTGTFTPPVRALQSTQTAGVNIAAITGTQTSLLIQQSNRFLDNSSVGATIKTLNTWPSIQPFAPFAPQFQYTPTVIGGSGYFDGNDFLTYTYGPELAFGTGDFTVEFWMYTSGTTSGILQGDINAGWGLFILSGTLYWQSVVNQTNRLIVSVAAYLNLAWRHWAIVRSGGTLSLYIDGQLITSVADSTNYADTAGTFNIGQAPVVGTFLTGYLSGLRIVKGTAVYTAAFTPPTAPPTAITNTSLLLNYTNAAITDGTMKNVLETVGNAQVSTSIVKYGAGSMAFDGNGDYLDIPASPNTAFGTGDFTVECWVYFNSLPGSGANMQIIDFRGGGSSVNTAPSISIFNNSGTYNVRIESAGTVVADRSITVTTGTWYHLAVVRNFSTGYVYWNGAQAGSSIATWTANYSTGFLTRVAAYTSVVSVLNGYIDDLRITRFARYTANFTPPQVALPRQ